MKGKKMRLTEESQSSQSPMANSKPENIDQIYCTFNVIKPILFCINRKKSIHVFYGAFEKFKNLPLL
jgi:hypothetical protein